MLLSNLIAAAAATAASDPPVPAIKFYQSGSLERYCAAVSPSKPDPKTVLEIRQRVPEFSAAWTALGPKLLVEVVELTRRPFRFAESAATLHACPDMQNMPMPLAIAAARYTKNSGAGAESGLVRRALAEGKRIPLLPPRSMDDFVYTVWHELMHRYVREVELELPGETTPLREKYSGDNDVTRAHIHLFAIEKLVWRKIGREKDYEARREEMRAKRYTNYVRAQDIVEIEGAERIIAELYPASGR